MTEISAYYGGIHTSFPSFKLGKNLEITHTATALQLFKGCDCKDKTGKTQKQLNKAVGMAIKEIEQGQTKKA
ncbi:unnamed protein product [Clonostachys rosea f. rosea IK726]|uniref:Uncharacterized protein n=1 Tax=Clonostachys rosea f. rosea IK726 TaxID=1349383 RepID=A0ACA9UE75_BIOOC|nr:unnamed protein product [Clonostachys rosea f. rosea IK726]